MRRGVTYLLVFLFCACYFCFLLGNRPFATPDEARYVEIPREMVETGDYITPRLNGVKYFEKPPLLYWLQAGVMKTFGLTETVMRSVTALLGALGVALTFAFATSTLGFSIGVLASLILATSPLYFAMAHMITLDMSTTVFITLALVFFYSAIIAEPGWTRRLRFWGFAVACALGVMTKGVMALAISGPIIVLWLTLSRHWSKLRPFYPISATILFLALVLPWHIAVSIQNPEFLYKYFIVEHVLRFTTNHHDRYQPIWFFIPILLIGFFPWSAFSPLLGKGLKNKSLKTYLMLWAFWPLLFFSFSHSKLVPYILPSFPPLAILLAHGLHNIGRSQDDERLKTGTAIIALIGLIGYFFPYDTWGIQHNIENFTRLFALLCCISGLIAFIGAWLRNKDYTYATLGALAFACNMILILATPFIQKPSVKPLLSPSLPLNDRIVSYEVYFQDLPVYSQRIVTVVDAKGELAFGCEVEDTSAWMINKAKFMSLWQSPEHLWVVMKKESLADFQRDYPKLFVYTYRQTYSHVLVSNKGEKAS